MTRAQYEGISLSQAEEISREAQITVYNDALRTFSQYGISVRSVQDEANRKADDFFENIREDIRIAGGTASGDELVDYRNILSSLDGRGRLPAFASGAHEAVIVSMMPAIRERLSQEPGVMISMARLEQITTDTIRNELQSIDRNTNWNITLGELNNYRVEHGLPEIRIPTAVASRE